MREAEALILLGLLSTEDAAALTSWYEEHVDKRRKEAVVKRLREQAADLGY